MSRACEDAFARWCADWYRLKYGPNIGILPYTTKEEQRDCGDVRVGPDATGRYFTYDEKAYSHAWDGCLIELLQDASPDANNQPGSMGWFYHLAKCDYLLCGYFDACDSPTLMSVYRVSLRRLRRYFSEIMLTTGDLYCRGIIVRSGYGITLATVIPWNLAKRYRCVESLTVSFNGDE